MNHVVIIRTQLATESKWRLASAHLQPRANMGQIRNNLREEKARAILRPFNGFNGLNKTSRTNFTFRPEKRHA